MVTIIATDQWMKQYLHAVTDTQEADFRLQRDFLCTPLRSYFPDASAEEVHHHLIRNGLFLPGNHAHAGMERLCDRPFWETAGKLTNQLQREWSGPSVPVFIFPVNLGHEQIRTDFRGKTGLAHSDKVFLFISGDISETAFQALLAHEYNHVCRLNAIQKPEETFTLLDTMILEGIAETAVLERLGATALAPWTTLYSREYVKSCWKKWLSPQLHTKKSDPRHQLLMYGGDSIPKWLGYCTGFHLVQSFKEKSKSHIQQLLRLSSAEIYEGSAFKRQSPNE